MKRALSQWAERLGAVREVAREAARELTTHLASQDAISETEMAEMEAEWATQDETWTAAMLRQAEADNANEAEWATEVKAKWKETLGKSAERLREWRRLRRSGGDERLNEWLRLWLAESHEAVSRFDVWDLDEVVEAAMAQLLAAREEVLAEVVREEAAQAEREAVLGELEFTLALTLLERIGSFWTPSEQGLDAMLGELEQELALAELLELERLTELRLRLPELRAWLAVRAEHNLEDYSQHKYLIFLRTRSGQK